ncbi:O-antigen ligase family protein [Kosmotoga pacifica]|uniref:O-antigen ligase family protein n=1 Tax=Kosmotoga pacifica TaxID=1330330 RepID=UPI00069C15F5|nr:O-antigen ligase family protein [Kosmotoga pacifica]
MKERREKLIDLELIVYFLLLLIVPLFIVKGFTHEPSTGKHLIYAVGFSIIFLLNVLNKREIRFKYNLVHLFAMGFGVAAVVSLFSVQLDNPHYLRYSLDVALFTLFVSLTGLYLSNKMNTRTKIELSMLFFIIGATVVALDAMLNYYAGYDLFLGKIGEPFARASARSTIGNPNFVSDYMGMALPMVFYFIASSKALHEVFGKKLWNQVALKTSMLIFMIPMISAVFIAETRTVITGIFLGNLLFISVYLLLRKRLEADSSDQTLKKITLFFILLAVIIVLVMSYLYLTPSPLTGGGKLNVTKRLEYALTSSSSWKERFSAWLNSVYQWVEPENKLRLLIGSGIGTFQLYHLLYTPYVISDHPEYSAVWNNFKRTHNDYLQSLSETGLLGFVMVLFFMIFLVWIYFRNLFKIKDRSDLLLYGAIGAGIFSLSLHTMFEFPLHMQPNLMGGVFLLSIAVGVYFNNKQKEANISKGTSIIVILAFFGVLSFLKTTAYIGEGYFRMGQTDQQYYYAYIREYVKADVNTLNKALSDLETFSGDYAYLKNLPEYFSVRGSDLKRKYPGLSSRQLVLKAEEERKKEIESIKSQLKNYLERAQLLKSKAREYYDSAVSNFRKSFSIYPVFGKPLWYLGGFGLKQERLFMEGYSLKDKLTVLVGDDPYANLVLSEFKGNTNIIPLPEKTIRTTPFKEFFERVGTTLTEKTAMRININLLAQIQMTLDAIDYYESSMIFFSERQTPKIVGSLYKQLYENLSSYLLYLPDSVEGLDVDRLRMLAENVRDYAAEMSVYWYDLAVTLLPGTWNRYPDWENIYSQYMEAVVTTHNQLEEVVQMLVDIAKRHASISVAMWNGGKYGIPDDTLDFCIEFSKKILSENVTLYRKFMEEVLMAYREIKEVIADKIERVNSDRLKIRMKKFLQTYETLSSALER